MHDTIYEYSIIEVQKFTLLLSTRTRDGKIRTQTKMAQRAIDYARSKLGYHEDYPATIHSSKFSKHISPNVYRRGTIEEWIKRGLFKTDGSYLAGTASLQYVVDRPFYEEILNLIAHSRESKPQKPMKITVKKDLADFYHDELNLKKPFIYEIKPCGRYHHNLIMEKREIKNELFAGWIKCDISSAAPNILHQLWIREGNHPLPNIAYYLSNKEKMRQTLGDRHGVNKEMAKRWLSGLFNKSRLLPGFKKRDQKEEDYELIKKLMAKVRLDPIILDLKEDIKTMWNGLEHLVPEDEKEWQLYFQEECKIRSVFEEYLSSLTGSLDVGYFIEHDGFRLHPKFASRFDIEILTRDILVRTGYVVEL